MTTETKTRRVSKDDWYVICNALQDYAKTLAEWSQQDNWSESMRETFGKQAAEALDILSHAVNHKLSERDKYAFFSEFVEW
jgi:hypothetical protein